MITRLVVLYLLVSTINAMYTQQGKDWTGLCQTGKRQSPINIEKDQNAIPVCEHIRFRYHGEQAVDTLNEGVTIKTEGNFLEFDLIGEDKSVKVFKALQFHFHTGSEHRVEGHQYPLELHLVTQQQNSQVDSFMAFAILFELASDEHEESIFIRKLQFPEKDQSGIYDYRLNLSSVFQAIFSQGQRIFTYKGSFTTPSCWENIFWNVIENPLKIKQSSLDKIKKVLSGEHMPNGNWRETQPLNQRNVTYAQFCVPPPKKFRGHTF